MKYSATILIVDDEPNNLELLEMHLTTMEYNVVCANNGEKALKIARTHDIDLILLDVMMPQMNGFEVTEKLKSDDKTRFIPIILVTILNDVSDRVRGIEAGCDDF